LIKNNNLETALTTKYSGSDLFKGFIIVIAGIILLILWLMCTIYLFIKTEIHKVNLALGYFWIIWISICLIHWLYFSIIKPLYINTIEVTIDNFQELKFQRYIGIIKSVFWGTYIYLLLFFFNTFFSSENYKVYGNPLDAWVVNGGKNTKDYIMAIAMNENKKYIFHTKYNYHVNWNFDLIKNSENYKGISWKNYSSEFLIDYYFNCKQIDMKIRDGLFGFKLIDNVIFHPYTSSI
tara:strand:+ start:414 stop:1121 length:708 start_codon:yes stop_codon:yes gene_type:complete